MLFYKLLILTLLFSLALSENEANEFGPFDVPSPAKLNRELTIDDEEIGIKEAVERRAKKQAEITLINGPKLAQTPSIEELLADLPLPLLQAVKEKSKELSKREIEMGNSQPETSPETRSLSSVPSLSSLSPGSSLVESSASKLSSLPSKNLPLELQSQNSLSVKITEPESVPLSDMSAPTLTTRASSPSNRNNELQDDGYLEFVPPPVNYAVPSLDSIPSPPHFPSINSQSVPIYQQSYPAMQHPSPYSPASASLLQQLPRSTHRYTQRGATPLRRYPRHQSKSLDPVNLSPGYPPFSLDGGPQMQNPSSLSSQFLQVREGAAAENPYYSPSSHATDLSLNSHDIDYTRQRRMNFHPEPLLPDLPLPPVVAPV